MWNGSRPKLTEKVFVIWFYFYLIDKKKKKKKHKSPNPEIQRVVGETGVQNEKDPSFHQKVMSFKNEPNSNGLQKLVLSIGQKEFSQLKEGSFDLVFPIIVSWLQESPTLRTFALVFLIEAVDKFRKFFLSPQRSVIIKQCFEGNCHSRKRIFFINWFYFIFYIIYIFFFSSKQ